MVRPDLSTTWLAPENKPHVSDSPGKKRSFVYWTQIHWATPPWITVEMWQEIKALYNSAEPRKDEVDHIVPLKHPLVCGLNVPWNLQVLTVRENQNKSNHHWPDCPDHLCPIKNLPRDMFFEIPLYVRHPQLEMNV